MVPKISRILCTYRHQFTQILLVEVEHLFQKNGSWFDILCGEFLCSQDGVLKGEFCHSLGHAIQTW